MGAGIEVAGAAKVELLIPMYVIALNWYRPSRPPGQAVCILIGAYLGRQSALRHGP